MASLLPLWESYEYSIWKSRLALAISDDVILGPENVFKECSITGCLILCISLDNRSEYWWSTLQFSKDI